MTSKSSQRTQQRIRFLAISLLVIPTVLIQSKIALSAETKEGKKSATKIASLEDRIKIVKMIRNSIATNLDNIKTWKGEFFVQDKEYVPIEKARKLAEALGHKSDEITGPLRRVQSGVYNFSFDAGKASVFSAYVPQPSSGWSYAETGEVVFKIFHVSKQRSIITPDHYLHMAPEEIEGRLRVAQHILPSEGPVAFRDTIETARINHLGIAFDPRNFFICEQPILYIFDNAIASMLEGEKRDGVLTDDERKLARAFVNVTKITFEEDPNRLAYDVSLGPLPQRNIPHKLVYTADSDAGFNVVQFTNSDGSRMATQLDWNFRNEGGVHLPEYFRKIDTTSDGEYKAFVRILELRKSVLNQPIPQSTFSYSNLGMKDGDRLEDVVAKKVYVLNNGKLETPKKDPNFNLDVVPEGERESANGYGLFAVNIIVVILLVGAIVWRRMSKK